MIDNGYISRIQREMIYRTEKYLREARKAVAKAETDAKEWYRKAKPGEAIPQGSIVLFKKRPYKFVDYLAVFRVDEVRLFHPDNLVQLKPIHRGWRARLVRWPIIHNYFRPFLQASVVCRLGEIRALSLPETLALVPDGYEV